MSNVRRISGCARGPLGPNAGPITDPAPLLPCPHRRSPHPSVRAPGAVPSHFAAASERLVLCSLAKMRLMWFLTVFSLMKQAAAICWLFMPDAMRSMISASLALSRYLDLSGAAGRPLVHPDDDCATSGCSCERFSAEVGGGGVGGRPNGRHGRSP